MSQESTNSTQVLNVDRSGIAQATYTDREGRQLWYTGFLPSVTSLPINPNTEKEVVASFTVDFGKFFLTCKDGESADINFEEGKNLQKALDKAVASGKVISTGFFSDDYAVPDQPNTPNLKSQCEAKGLR